MSKQTINIGASPNDGTGTPLRTSFDYTNQNFTEIYTALGGGVALPGATTQVIFNDGGTNLAGDAGLVYNKTTDALTVAGLVTAGSATITGALTANGNIAMANATAITSGGAVVLYVDTNLVAIRARATNGIRFQESTGANNLLTVSDAGVFGFLDGAGGTRMTLNSTGLGIGVAPVTGAKLAVAGPIVRDKGTVTATISVATTFATLPGEGLYIVYAYTNASNPAAFTSYAVILADSSGSRVVANNGTQITITTSTFALQVTQIFFPSVTVLWSYVQIG
jgi:hypothetical protein